MRNHRGRAGQHPTRQASDWWGGAGPEPPLPHRGLHRRLLRPVAAAAALAAVVALIAAAPQLAQQLECRQDGQWLPNDLRSVGAECVGVTDGSYLFGSRFPRPDGKQSEYGRLLDDVQTKIKAENELTAREEVMGTPETGGTNCTGTATAAVTIAVAAPWSSPLMGVRSAFELQGIHAAQWQANRGYLQGSCQPRIKVLVANAGQDGQGWDDVVDALIARQGDEAPLVAVIGMGVSSGPMFNATRRLTAERIPVIADIATADGFDGSNFAAVDVGCKTGDLDPSGRGSIDGNLFRRVVHPTQVQAEVLSGWLRVHHFRTEQSALVHQVSTNLDPYACSAEKAWDRAVKLPDDRHINLTLSTNGRDALGAVKQAADEICDSRPALTSIRYAARGLDLAPLVKTLGGCLRQQLTIVSTDDASQLLTPTVNPAGENIRKDALKVLADDKVTLVFTPLATRPPINDEASKAYLAFETAYKQLKFDPKNLLSGHALVGHDALVTVAGAVHQADLTSGVDLAQVRDRLLKGGAVPDTASGLLDFGVNGNPLTKPPAGSHRRSGPTPNRICVTRDLQVSLSPTPQCKNTPPPSPLP